MSTEGNHYLPLLELKEIFVTKTEYKELSDMFLERLAAVEKGLTEELQLNRQATDKLQNSLDALTKERDDKLKRHERHITRLIALAGILVALFSLVAGRVLTLFGVK